MAQLVYKIDSLVKERGIKQPDVSKMLQGEFRQFWVERLLRSLVALGQMSKSW